MLLTTKTSTIIFGLALATACQRPAQRYPSDTKVVGGKNATASDPTALSTVALLDANGSSYCTATIIGPNHLVSAAHCFDGAPGPAYIGSGPNGLAVNNITNIRFKAHPAFSMNSLDIDPNSDGLPAYDIAVLVFDGSLQGTGLEPVEVASPQTVARGTPVVIAGYGVTELGNQDGGLLRYATTPISGTFQGRREFDTRTPKTSSCFGDSGGPNYIQVNGKLAVAAAVSRGTEQRCSAGYSINTDVTRYQGWMKCSFETLEKPLTKLTADESAADCQMGRPKGTGLPSGQGVGTPPSGQEGAYQPGDQGPQTMQQCPHGALPIIIFDRLVGCFAP